MPTASIRPYRDSDLDDLYRVCLLTGDGGQDASALFDDPRILGHVMAGPYGVFEPSLAFVAEDELGVGGYIIGTLDSTAFWQRLEADWWPALRERYPAPPPGLAPEQLTADQRWAGYIRNPPGSPGKFTPDYPSHLHVNLLPRLQSQGLGRRMMTTMLDALRARGSAGVHFFVSPRNQRAIGFYRHLGFTETPHHDALIFTMDLRHG